MSCSCEHSVLLVDECRWHQGRLVCKASDNLRVEDRNSKMDRVDCIHVKSIPRLKMLLYRA